MRTYGTLDHRDGKWVLKAEPHVILRAKRVFAQVSKKQAGALLLTDTIQTARDVEWFLERYPLTAAAPVLDRLTQRARAYEESIALVQRITARTADLPSFEMRIPPRRYQAEAAAIALATGRLLVGDVVGLGKTATAIAVMVSGNARPAVVVTLTHLPAQWEAELQRFAPQLRVFRPKKSEPQKRDLELLTGFAPPDVIVIGYSKLAGWAQTLAETFGARCVVFDEVQELRTGTGTAKGAAAELLASKASIRVGLSATPVYNYGGEIWNLLHVLDPQVLGSHGEFAQEWCGGDSYSGKDKVKDPKALGTYLRDVGVFVRRTIADVVDEVPELRDPIRIPHLVESDSAEITSAKSAAAELARVILSSTATGAEKMRAGGEIDWRMRQATGIAKAAYVATFVRMLLEGGVQKVLLFGWHRAVYDLWKEKLAEFQPVFFTGEESATQKEAARLAFVSGSSRVLVMSLRAGAGLDGLQKVCCTVVFGELDWSPGVHDQCIGRVHRPGQEDSVRAYFLHTDDGSDPVVVEVLGLKKAQARGIVDPDAPLLEPKADAEGHIRRLAEACLGRDAAKEAV